MFETLSAGMEGVFRRLRGRGRLSSSEVDRALADMRTALLQADVEVGVAGTLLERIRARAVGAEVMKSLTPGLQVLKLVKESLAATLGEAAEPLNFAERGLTVMMVVGLQGSGKTTSAVKLARYVRDGGRRPLLVAADRRRPAAAEQLRRLGEQIGVPVFGGEKGEKGESGGGGDAVRLVKRALAYASDEGNGADVMIVDTAGRLAVDRPLMDELSRIAAVASPQETLLVLDAMTGADAVRTALGFLEYAAFTGVILSKLDGDARGGAAISVREVTGRPIKLAGVGERPEDLEVFHPERMASRILGMGDLLTVIERAEQVMQDEETAQAAKRIRRAEFTLDDFLSQFAGLRRMGPVSDLVGMLPVAQSASVDATAAEREIGRAEAIIRSMTPLERNNPKLIDGSRRRRIASGSGTSVQDVSAMLRQFDNMRRMLQSAPGVIPGFEPPGTGRGFLRPSGGGRRKQPALRQAARPAGGQPRTPRKQQKHKKKKKR